MLRSAECAGVTGIVLPRHRSAHLSPTVAKVAAGAIEYLPMALVAGVPTALQQLAGLGRGDGGAGRRGAHARSTTCRWATSRWRWCWARRGRDWPSLTRRRCDELAAIPQHGTLSSLNVATAGAIACFDVARQRSSAGH